MNWQNSSGQPRQLNIEGHIVSKASIIASKMNTFFLDKVEIIQNGIETLPHSLSRCVDVMRGKNCKLDIGYVKVSKVLKIIKGLSNSKSIAMDELDNYSVKIAAEIIAHPLHHIITLSLMQCKFPTSWKFSKVLPLHKKSSKLEMKNYRPIAILSPISKVLEKLLMNKSTAIFQGTKYLMKTYMATVRIDPPRRPF